MNPLQMAGLAACFLTSVSPAWAVQKCVGQDGKVSYQEAPCNSGVKSAEALKLTPVAPTTPFEARVNAAIATSKIMVGMTAEQARRSWGAPTKINRSIGTYGTHEQWVYDLGRSRSQYVYIENGIVASMQSPD